MRRYFCLSVRLFVTLVDCVKTGKHTTKLFLPAGNPAIPVYPETRHNEINSAQRGHYIQVRHKNINFRPISGYISETIRNMHMITI